MVEALISTAPYLSTGLAPLPGSLAARRAARLRVRVLRVASLASASLLSVRASHSTASWGARPYSPRYNYKIAGASTAGPERTDVNGTYYATKYACNNEPVYRQGIGWVPDGYTQNELFRDPHDKWWIAPIDSWKLDDCGAPPLGLVVEPGPNEDPTPCSRNPAGAGCKGKWRQKDESTGEFYQNPNITVCGYDC